jgi:hypothetical protein
MEMEMGKEMEMMVELCGGCDGRSPPNCKTAR